MMNNSRFLLAGILALTAGAAQAASPTVQDGAHAPPATRGERTVAIARAAMPRPDPRGVDAPTAVPAEANDLSASWTRYATSYPLAGGGG